VKLQHPIHVHFLLSVLNISEVTTFIGQETFTPIAKWCLGQADQIRFVFA